MAKFDDRAGLIDLFWPSVLIVEQKSAGRDLSRAYDQAGEYFGALPERDRPSYILVSDFRTFELPDLDERETVTFPLAASPARVEAHVSWPGTPSREETIPRRCRRESHPDRRAAFTQVVALCLMQVRLNHLIQSTTLATIRCGSVHITHIPLPSCGPNSRTENEGQRLPNVIG